MKNKFLLIKEKISSLRISKARIYLSLFLILVGITLHTVFATTPDPGHPWSEVGDGTFQVIGPTIMRTYTVTNSNATLLTTADPVTVAQGGLGMTNYTQGDIPYSNATDNYAKVNKSSSATRYFANTAANNNPTWAQVDLTNGISGTLPTANGGNNNAFTQLSVSSPTALRTYTLPDATSTILTSNDLVTLAQGGTAKSLTASNGGILYSDADSMEVLAGTATAGQVLRSGANAAPTWSTATYPDTASTEGKRLVSDGTNFVSTTPATITTATNKPYSASGAAVSTTTNTLTAARVGLFNLHATLSLSQIAYNAASTATPGTVRICIYDEAGTTKLVDVTDVPAIGVNPVTVSPAVTLPPGNYYVTIQCATTCSNAITSWTSNAIAMSNGANVPSGKKVIEGTVTTSSGTCNSSLGTITVGVNQMPMLRLDA